MRLRTCSLLSLFACSLTLAAGLGWMAPAAIGLTSSAPLQMRGDPDDRIFADGFELPPPPDCSVPDADGDGLLDAHCITPFMPPDPATVAPPIDPTVITDFNAANAFLHAGTQPVQQGVAPGTIPRHRAAVLRGLVKSAAGAPLPGVLVRVLNHPELGYTYTRADGLFDLMVAGGGTLTVDYQKAGHLRVQRTAEVPWQNWTWVEDAVLIALDAQKTVLSMSSASPAQVARGSTSTDADGERRGTVIVPAGTQAAMTLWNGSVQALPQISFRATEYTVGADGPERMPGELPPASGYTYAIELSSDEALAANAKQVSFSKPLAFYVENFLGFPVGGAVPVGAYDFRSASWVPEANGRIVKVLSVAGSSAVLDVDGSDRPASAAQLAALGIDTAELQRLATLYAPGRTLWRVRIPHLTPWDLNWPYGPDPNDEPPPDGEPPPDDDDPPPDEDDNPPPDSNPPPDEPPNNDPPSDSPPEDESNTECGSVIDCDNLRLGEVLPVAGTGISLTYRSDRVPAAGRRPLGQLEHSFKMRVTGATIPTRLRRVEAVVHLLGQRLTFESSSLTPNRTVSFTWNERDAYDRPGWLGPVSVMAQLGYVYPARYLEPGEFDQAFGAFSTQGIVLTSDRDRNEVTLWRHWDSRTRVRILFGAPTPSFWDARGVGLGGWTPSVHHVFDPQARVLYKGDGRRSNVGTYQSNGVEVLQRVEGVVGESVWPLADGSLLHLDRYHCIDPVEPGDAAVGGDLCDPTLQRAEYVVRAHPDGTRTILADSCLGAQQCRDPLWTDASDLAVAGDDIYFVSRGEGVYRLAPDGDLDVAFSDAGCRTERLAAWRGTIYVPCTAHLSDETRIFVLDGRGSIRLFAGGGSSSAGTVPAYQAKFGALRDLAVGPEGEVYVADGFRVKRIDAAGTVRTVAGTGSEGDSDDGVAAIAADLGAVHSLAVSGDGMLYLFETSRNGRVRELRPDGRLYTHLGGGTESLWANDRFALARSDLGTGGRVRTYTDGSVIFHDSAGAWRLPRSSFRFGSEFETGFEIPSRDGGELYEFDLFGRHLRTRHVLTGATKYLFRYTAQGHLSEIEDGNGNVTRILRNAGGAPTHIRSPYGQLTQLRLDANGFLDEVRSPASQVWSMDYTPGGLMQRFTRPSGFGSEFEWRVDRRLHRDTDAEGGFKELTVQRWANRQQERVRVLTAEGRTRDYVRDLTRFGARQRWATDANGHTRTDIVNDRATQSVRSAAGDIVRTDVQPDPRFALEAPLIGRYVYTERENMPTIRLEKTAGRIVNPIAADAGLGQFDIHDDVQVNGRLYTGDYDAAQRTLTHRTPMNRAQTVRLDTQQRPAEIAIPGLAAARYQYDVRGRIAFIRIGTGADERVTQFGYDANGHLSTIIDPLNRTTTLANDAAGRVIAQTLPDARVIGFGYDANGNVTSVTPPGRPAHGFGYNRVDRATRYTAPGATATAYAYNLDKQLELITRPGGATLELDYEAGFGPGDRLRMLRTPAGNYEYGYATGSPLLRSVLAPPVDGVRPMLIIDRRGSLPAGQQWTGAGAVIRGSVAFDYDDNLWLKSVTVNDSTGGLPYSNVRTDYGYDDDGLLTGVKVPALTPAVPALALTRNAGNGLLEGSTQNRISDAWTYNAFAEPTGYEAKFDSMALYTVAYQRDKLGRITRKTETLGGSTTVFDYGYDLAGRLDTVHRNGTLVSDYAYDANSNRTSLTTTAGTVTGTYDDQDRLLIYGDCDYEYQPGGELRKKTCGPTGARQVTEYDYDALGNLRTAKLPDGRRLTYVIDGFNRRIGKKIDGTLVQGFLYLNQLKPVAELDGAGAIKAVFVYGERPNVPSFLLKGGRTYRVIADQLGSPRLVVDVQSGAIAQRLDYDEFGNVLTDTSPGFQPFGFAGGIYDRDIKLTRFGARDYDNARGRWTSTDQLRFKATLNGYSYAGSDPINWIDSSGFSKTDALHGLGKDFWNWYHRNIKRPGDPDLAKDEARELYQEWESLGKPGPDNRRNRRKDEGFIDADLLLDLLTPWFLTPSELGCSELDCDHNGVPDWQERMCPVE